MIRSLRSQQQGQLMFLNSQRDSTGQRIRQENNVRSGQVQSLRTERTASMAIYDQQNLEKKEKPLSKKAEREVIRDMLTKEMFDLDSSSFTKKKASDSEDDEEEKEEK